MAYIVEKEGWITEKAVLKIEGDRDGNVTSWGTQYFCSECNSKLTGKEQFCPNCGVALEETIKEESPGPFHDRIDRRHWHI